VKEVLRQISFVENPVEERLELVDEIQVLDVVQRQQLL
jgi:hypothetical protein